VQSLYTFSPQRYDMRLLAISALLYFRVSENISNYENC